MNHKQMAYQKYIFIAVLVLSSITLVYSLGFATDLYSLNYHTDPTNSMLYVKGAEIYDQIQPFNKVLLEYAAILFGLCIIMFMTLTHRRRLYYASNYITTIGYLGYSGFLSTTLLVNVLYIKQQYLAIDFVRVKEVKDFWDLQYVKSTFMMDAGIALSAALYMLAAALVINLIWKTVNMAKEKRQARGDEE